MGIIKWLPRELSKTEKNEKDYDYTCGFTSRVTLAGFMCKERKVVGVARNV